MKKVNYGTGAMGRPHNKLHILQEPGGDVSNICGTRIFDDQLLFGDSWHETFTDAVEHFITRKGCCLNCLGYAKKHLGLA